MEESVPLKETNFRSFDVVFFTDKCDIGLALEHT